MKKYIYLFCCLYVFNGYSQTTFLSRPIPGNTPASSPTLSPKIQNAINLYNATVKSFLDTTDERHYILLYNALYDSLLNTLPVVKKLRDTLPRDSASFLPVNYLAFAARADSIKFAVPQSAGTTSLCPGLSGFTLNYIYLSKESALGVLKDSTGAGVQSFTLTQSNEELFYDKIRTALKTYCDSSNIETVIAAYKKVSLYKDYLEGQLTFNNPNEPAGTLKITRTITVHYNDGDEYTYTKLNLGSMTRARSKIEKALEAAQNQEKKLEELQKKADSQATSVEDKAWIEYIRRIHDEVKRKLNNATAYLNSIVKFPDSMTGQNFNQAVDLSREAEKAANKAIRFIEQMDKQFKKAGIPNGHGAYSAHIVKINPGVVRLAGEQFASVDEHLAKSPTDFLLDTVFTIQSIQIQFQDGFIENIKVFGKLKGDNRLLRFENEYPVAFSTKRDFKNLIDIKLFEKSDYHRNANIVLYLGEIISYNQKVAVNNKDYSPANQVISIDALTDSIKEIQLYKDQTSKILELQVFSDLKGADDSNPNGLIQLELIKKLNLFSKRWGVSPKIWPWNWGSGRHYNYMANVGFFNFITPSFSIDKVEENQKRLILSHIDNLSRAADTSRPVTYASTINLLRHQIYGLGVDLSAITLDIPNIKSTINFGMGIRFGRTALQDTFRLRDTTANLHFTAAATNNVIQYGVNTFQWGPYATWQIFPDSRFGISGTQRFSWFQALSSEFIQVRDSAHYLSFVSQNAAHIRTAKYSYAKCLASAEIFAYFSPNPDGSNKLFFRYRLNWDVANPRQNFQQIQVGFSTYLTATKEYDNLKKKADIP